MYTYIVYKINKIALESTSVLTCSVIARCVQGAFSEIIDRWCPKEDIRSNQVAHCFLTHSQSWMWILISAPAARRPKTSWSCAPWNQPLISNVDHYSSLMVAFLTYLQSCTLCLANLEHDFGNLLPIFLQWTNWVDETCSGVTGVTGLGSIDRRVILGCL